MPDSVLASLSLFMTRDVILALESSLALIFLDVMLGILQSLSRGQFNPRKLPQFLQTGVLPYIGSLTLMALFSSLLPEVKILFFTAVATTDAKFLFDVKDKVTQLVGIKQNNTLQLPEKGTLVNMSTPDDKDSVEGSNSDNTGMIRDNEDKAKS